MKEKEKKKKKRKGKEKRGEKALFWGGGFSPS
jgi:hypothetical protein